MIANNWNCYFGVVAEDKAYDSNEIKVFVPEHMPFMSGDIADHTSVEESEIVIADNELEITTKVKTSNVLIASYFDMTTNRSGPPDVRKGEQVLVYQHSDEDKYYWMPTGRDDNLRKQERLRIAISDDEANEKLLGSDNTYFIELDTLHNKHIHLSTSKSDGEEYAYTIKVDAKNNKVAICDDDENEILLDSTIPSIRLKNKHGTALELLKHDVILNGRDVVIKAIRQLLLNSPSITTSSKSGACVFRSKSIDLQADHINLDASAVSVTGFLQVAKTLLAKKVHALLGYSIVKKADKFGKPDVNLENGRSSCPPATPTGGSGGGSNRHCVAHEDSDRAINEIVKALRHIDSHGIQLPVNLNGILSDYTKSKMPKNQGE